MNSLHLPQFKVEFDEKEKKEFVLIKEDEFRHLKVLRLKTNEKIKVFDGKGNYWLAQLVKIEKNNAIAKLLQRIPVQERFLEITVASGIPKRERADWIVEKLAELGVASFIPVIFKRSVVKPKHEGKKIKRWQRIAEESSKQSNQPYIMEVLAPIKAEGVLNLMKNYDVCFIAITGAKSAKETFSQIKTKPKHVLIIIGPEGGFDPEEQELFIESGAIPIGLGNSVLRVETAALVATAWLKYTFNF